MHDRGATNKLTYNGPWGTSFSSREALPDISSRPTGASRSATMVAGKPWPDHRCFTSIPSNSRRGAPHLKCGPYSGRLVLPNVRANPDRGGRHCKPGLRRW